MPYTAVPCFSFSHQLSEYTCSKWLYSCTTGNIWLSVLALCSSLRSRGNTTGSG